ncbi:DNA replication licensing factor mcm8 [Dissophora globulifera]|nr:DNA replication licensing factor mcm8 [Dissophora globulifera]
MEGVSAYLDYHSEHEYRSWITEFVRYIQEHHLHGLSREQWDALTVRRILIVNLKNVAQSCNIPDVMDLAMHRPTAKPSQFQAIFGDASAKTMTQRKFTVRLSSFDKVTHGKDLKANLIVVRRCKPWISQMHGFFSPQNVQKLAVEEGSSLHNEKLPDERLDSGRVPRTVDCEVTNDLVDRVIPGDVVEITGIVKVTQSEKSYSRNNSTGNTMYLLYLDVNYLKKSTMTLEEDDVDQDYDAKDASKDSKDSIQVTMKDLYAIEELHLVPQLFKLVVNSFSPAIYGNEMVKAGILFALFGGRRRSKGVIDRTAIRSDPHVLIVGDPGLGKSQLLTAAVKIAPRGVYVCGSSGISTSGLTVTLVRGSGSDFALEAGALVLGDQGCCCIDEFDKMTTDHNALLEAMEQQSISIAKAGIICTLPARTSVIAAANPVGGHYNMSKTVAENLKMNTALLSRFDLIFILLDKPNGEMDQYLSNHIMALHSGNASGGRAFRSGSSQDSGSSQSQPSLGGDSKSRMDRPLSERLRMTDEDQMDLIPQPLLRKFIAYARQYVHPKLSPEAAATLQEFYLILRTRHRSADGTPVTTRQLESLIRMAEAKARMELREVVTRRDAMDVIEIMTFSLHDAFGQPDPQGLSQSQGQPGRGKGASIKKYGFDNVD